MLQWNKRLWAGGVGNERGLDGEEDDDGGSGGVVLFGHLQRFAS